MGKKTMKIENCSIDKMRQLVGVQDRNAKLIEMHYHSEVVLVDDAIIVSSDDNEVLNKVVLVFETLNALLEKGYQLDETLVMQVINLADNDQLQYFFKLNEVIVGKTKMGKVICPKTLGQLEYINALNKYEITFGIGPAGTGKTYLAVVNAVTMLKQGKVRKIILTRPAVEAGENLGFLPGDLKEKVDPYLRPLYDALYDSLGYELKWYKSAKTGLHFKFINPTAESEITEDTGTVTFNIPVFTQVSDSENKVIYTTLESAVIDNDNNT